MLDSFSNIKVHPLQIANNEISEQHIRICQPLFNQDDFIIPVDYLLFIKQFGEGLLGNCIRIYPVSKMFKRTVAWRETGPSNAETLFFNEKQNERTKCVVIGDAFDDQIIFHLNCEYYFSSLYYTEQVYRLGESISDVFTFFRDHDIYGKNDMTHFEPFDSSLYRIFS